MGDKASGEPCSGFQPVMLMIPISIPNLVAQIPVKERKVITSAPLAGKGHFSGLVFIFLTRIGVKDTVCGSVTKFCTRKVSDCGPIGVMLCCCRC